MHAVLDCISRALEISTDSAIISRADHYVPADPVSDIVNTRPHTNDFREMSSLQNHFLRDLNDLGREIEKRYRFRVSLGISRNLSVISKEA